MIIVGVQMMGLLSKIFGSKKDVSNVDIDNKAKSSVKNVPRNENCIKLMEFASHMEKLLAEDRYIARSDYKKYIDEYQKIISFFSHFLQCIYLLQVIFPCEMQIP